MKQLLLLLSIISLYSFGQYPQSSLNIKYLKAVDGLDSMRSYNSIIYGAFVPRLGFNSSFKFEKNEISLLNIETGEMIGFKIIPEFKIKKYYLMIFHVKPGKYKLMNYCYIRRFGGIIKTCQEPILKTNSEMNNIKLADTLESNKFVIDVKENAINYIGHWSFKETELEFYNLKPKLDTIVKKTYLKLNFNKAENSFPQ